MATEKSYEGSYTVEERGLTMPREGQGNNDPTLDKTLVRPMDRIASGSGSKSEATKRKEYPLYTGLLKYFPDALMEVAHLSKVGNDQHNPGEPLHWAREKSQDQLDALARHLKDHASGTTRDSEGERHLTKVAWRALAELQLEIERDRAYIPPKS